MAWKYWRYGSAHIDYCEAATQTDLAKVVTELSDFIDGLQETFKQAGLDESLMLFLPSPSQNKKSHI